MHFDNFVKLSSLCTRIGDGLHGTPDYIIDSDIYFINGNNIKNGSIVVDTETKRVSQVVLRNNYIELNENTLLISINGTLGNIAFYKGEKIMLGKSAAYLNFKTDCNKFYYYYFQLPSVQKYFYDVATGSTIKNLSLKSLQDFLVPKPKELVWRKIACTLSALDSKIELNNRINSELEQMARTLYEYWFVQFDFPDKKGKPYKSSGGKMVYNETLRREIPEGWGYEQMNDLGTITGGSTPSRAIEDNFTQNGIPWITPKDLSMNLGNKYISKGEIDISEKGLKEASLNILDENSVLMSSRAPVGYLAINKYPCTTNQGFKSIVCNKHYSCEYVFYVLKQYMPKIEANATGSTFKEISASVLKSIIILKPSLEIINNYVNIVKPIFQMQGNGEEQNQQLAALRDWLLPMLMNGQVRVTQEAEENMSMAAEPEADYGN